MNILKQCHPVILSAIGGLVLCLLLQGTAQAYGTDIEWTGTMWAVNVPGKAKGQRLSMNEAREIVREYRWIYVNASLKSLAEGKEEAQKLSNAVGRPLVLIYLSRHVFDGTRGDYCRRFQDYLRMLVEHAMANGRELLVTGRSYGVHQALRVLRHFDSPKILLIGIAPSFGWLGNSVTSNVQQYIRDVEDTRCRYGMIASEDDGFTWRSGGAAYPDSSRVGGYRGDNDVGRAASRNTRNVTIEVITGADHAPIDEYLNHGLVNAMHRIVRHFNMQDTPVGDVVFGRATHSLKIVVDDTVGKGTFVARSGGTQRITFHVEDLVGRKAKVQVFVGGVMRKQYSLSEGQDATFVLTSRSQQVLLRAESGNQQGALTLQLDYSAPTFNHIAVSPRQSNPGSYVLSAVGVRDDGNWNTSDYQVHATIDGRRLSPRSGISVTVGNLSSGAHTAALRLRDRAGRFSATKTVRFNAGSQPPSLSFVSPALNAAVRRGHQLSITIRAGDPEGIMRVSLYLDRVSDDEFDSKKLYDFPGLFGMDQPEPKTCRVRANWSLGQHKLIAVAVDNSGQRTRVERSFRVVSAILSPGKK